jgi:hypothetical protein
MKKRLSLLLAALFVASTMAAVPVFASGDYDDKDKDKKYICHATGSDKNPYVLLYVPKNSAHFDKDKHPDDVKPYFKDGKPKCPDKKKDDDKDDKDY